MTGNRTLASAALLMSSIFSNASTATCTDPAWTAAITEAMGRAPLAGECNTRLYGAPSTHAEKVRAVRATLNEIYASCGGQTGMATQKLPLRRCGPGGEKEAGNNRPAPKRVNFPPPG